MRPTLAAGIRRRIQSIPSGHARLSRDSPTGKAHFRMYNVTLIPGDGVGPEIAAATQKCLEATGVKFAWDVQECGIEVIEKVGKVPDSVLASIRKNKVALKAPITTPIGKGFRSVNV
ncbi:MAG TPA: isocitrate/isopropylmalate family dehydrogenase, partial [Planctomycetaceae bacterium]|nr:isocitrate/isopropylmalate family dehydrogenase [Planctomycetaceae bacterium]